MKLTRRTLLAHGAAALGVIYSRRGSFQVYLGRGEKKGPAFRESGARARDHMQNFLDCVRSRKEPIASAREAHLSCALVHLGETAYRVGRVLQFDPAKERVIGDDEANRLLTKEYRAPWGVS